MMNPEEFIKKSKYWERNELDKTNGFRVKRDMHDLAYSELQGPAHYAEEFDIDWGGEY